MIVREMLEKDVKEIVEIEQELYKSPWKKEHFLYEIIENEFSYHFVLEHNTKIIGYYIFWHLFEEANLTKISVSKQYQGRGLSKILLNDCLSRIKILECEKVYLEVRESNLIAINLYKGFGFKEVSIRKKYYDDNENALIFEMNLGVNING